jgi:hypothetical protein
MEPNDYQVGGNHYDSSYMHWDFVCDTGLHYLLGCATKYIERWRKKDGIKDLKKAAHYIAKFESREVHISTNYEHWDLFLKPMPPEEQKIMSCIYNGKFQEAQDVIAILIMQTEEDEDLPANYIDPDNNYFRG